MLEASTEIVFVSLVSLFSVVVVISSIFSLFAVACPSLIASSTASGAFVTFAETYTTSEVPASAIKTVPGGRGFTAEGYSIGLLFATS